MKPKDLRDRVFKYGKPVIRGMEPITEDDAGDLKYLWAAYKTHSFPFPDNLSQDEFTDSIVTLFGKFQFVWIIEDKNAQFSAGEGPIGLVVAHYDGWELEPHFEPFSWATAKNKLKGILGFLHKMQYRKEVGVIKITSMKQDQKFFNRLTRYLPRMSYSGMIKNGSPRGDKYMFYMTGRMK